MKTANKPKRDQALKQEHERMAAINVWKSVLRCEVPKHAKAITTSSTMKTKANGKLGARVNPRGFVLIDGKHYNSHNI